MGRQDIRDHINGLYFKSGKLKDGKGATEILTRKGEKSYCATEHSTSTAENKCKDMFRGHILKFKRSKKKTRQRYRRKKIDEKKRISDGDVPVKEVNVAALISLNVTQVYWLKQMMERRLISDQACTLVR